MQRRRMERAIDIDSLASDANRNPGRKDDIKALAFAQKGAGMLPLASPSSETSKKQNSTGSAGNQQNTYIIKPGDSLSKIARTNNISLDELVSLNKKILPKGIDTIIYPDDVLIVSSPATIRDISMLEEYLHIKSDNTRVTLRNFKQELNLHTSENNKKTNIPETILDISALGNGLLVKADNTAISQRNFEAELGLSTKEDTDENTETEKKKREFLKNFFLPSLNMKEAF